VTKWAELIVSPAAVPEMVRQAFQKAATERPGATYLGLPEDVEATAGLTGLRPLARADEPDTLPAPGHIVKYAESFGAKGYQIEAAADLLPTLKQALADDTVSVIACPVDYSENMKLTEKLGQPTQPI
jgi:thiamine pyrophosphate-dependent acetolactate synthase large subunit-like protein